MQHDVKCTKHREVLPISWQYKSFSVQKAEQKQTLQRLDGGGFCRQQQQKNSVSVQRAEALNPLYRLSDACS